MDVTCSQKAQKTTNYIYTYNTHTEGANVIQCNTPWVRVCVDILCTVLAIFLKV